MAPRRCAPRPVVVRLCRWIRCGRMEQSNGCAVLCIICVHHALLHSLARSLSRRFDGWKQQSDHGPRRRLPPRRRAPLPRSLPLRPRPVPVVLPRRFNRHPPGFLRCRPYYPTHRPCFSPVLAHPPLPRRFPRQLLLLLLPSLPRPSARHVLHPHLLPSPLVAPHLPSRLGSRRLPSHHCAADRRPDFPPSIPRQVPSGSSSRIASSGAVCSTDSCSCAPRRGPVRSAAKSEEEHQPDLIARTSYPARGSHRSVSLPERSCGDEWRLRSEEDDELGALSEHCRHLVRLDKQKKMAFSMI